MSARPLHNAFHSESVKKLRQRIALNLAIEESMLAALSDSLHRTRNRMTQVQVAEVEQAIRTHRVGMMKQKAILGAFGIDV